MPRKSRELGMYRRTAVRRHRKRRDAVVRQRHLRLESLEARRLLSVNPIISEIEAGNKSGIVDAAGVAADWLEIYNPDPQQAVNLSGWSLNYSKTNASWAFPNNVTLGPGEFRIIFCDSTPTTDPVGELHTNFNLSKEGSTVSLVNGSNAVVSSLSYPALSSDTSYGVGETVTETKLVAAGAKAQYYAPTSNFLDATWMKTTFNDSSWLSGPTGLGFANSVNGFATTLYRANIAGTVGTLGTAEAVISTPAQQISAISKTQGALNFLDTGGYGHFAGDYAFPGMTVGQGLSNIVLQAQGTLQISASQAGYYTFGVNSDDGFSLTITGANFSNGVSTTTCSGSTMAYDGGRGASDSLGTTYLAAGNYPIRLVYFQGGGGDSMEFFAAKESTAAGVTSFDANSILVGNASATTANGGTSTTTTPLLVTSTPFNGITSNSGQFAAEVATNVKSAIQSAMTTSGHGTSLYTRIKFDSSTYSPPSTLTLKMQADDGYVAYLNGVRVASMNAPSVPAWNSVATEEQTSDVQATTFQNVDLTPYIGSITPKAISSLTSSNTTATVTLPNHGFANGDVITIAGASPSQYNGSFVITNVSTNSFSYTISGPAAPAAGTITACRKTNVLAVQVLLSANSLSVDGDLLVVPELSQITGVVGGQHYFSTPTPGAANALGNIQPDITFSTKHGFYYAPIQVALTPNIAGALVRYTTDNNFPTPAVAGPAKAITSITCGGPNNLTATVTCAGHGFYTGNQVQIAGAAQPQYDGIFNITVLGVNSFSYTMSSAPAVNASGNMTAAGIAIGTVNGKTITSISYGGASGTTATVTCAGHGYSNGQQVQIAGAAQWQYDGDFTITYVDANTFTYTMSAAPGVNATGSLAAAAVSTLTYTGPIRISTTTDLEAAMVVSGVAGPPETESYIFPIAVVTQPASPAGFPTTWNGTIDNESAAADYAMSPVAGYTTQQVVNALSSLPTMSLVTTNDNLFGNSGIYANSTNHTLEVPGSFEYFDAKNASTDYGALVGLQVYGGYGRQPQFLKHSFAILFDQANGPSSMSYDIFGDGYKPDRLILRHGFNDGWAGGGGNAQYIVDQWTRDALTALGTPNTPGIWVQVFVNGLYWGLYNAVAHIDNNYAAHYFGGQPADYDIIHVGSGFSVVAGDTAAWTTMFNVATTGTTDGSGPASPTALASPTAYALMAQYLNLPSFCDYIITNYYGGNWDWDWHNYTAIYSKTAGTGFVFNDWDAEGNLQDPGTNITNRDTTGGPSQLLVQLLANADFQAMIADRVYRDLSGALSPTTAAATYQREANTISQAIIAESARWGNISGTQYTPANWTARLNWEIGSYFPVRTGAMFTQFQTAVTFAPATGGSVTYTMYPSVNPPALSLNGQVENGGTFTPGSVLTMSATTGTIYYTTDGSDPRASGGGLGATAAAYTTAITLTQGVEIKARAYSGSTWSALNDSPFYVDLAPYIRITELMYSPLPATAAEIAAGYKDTGNGAEDFEFVELQNIGTSALPLQGLAFTHGVTFTFPSVSLAAGAYIVVCSNASAFAIRYGSSILASEYGSSWATTSQYAGHFNNGGETVTLNAPNGGEIVSFGYSNSWYPQTDGGGFSLVVRSVAQGASLWNSSSGWEPGGTPNGTPGAAESVALPLPGSIVVNEVLSHTSVSPGDMIEFYNTSSQPIDISGWFVSDSGSKLMKYQIAAGTTIAASGYYVLTEDYNFGALASGDPGRLVAFALSEHGDDVYLSNVYGRPLGSNYGGQPGGYREHQTVDGGLNGVSRGLYVKSTGGTDFTLLQTPTFGLRTGNSWSGGPNAIPYVSPLVTDEIMYDPPAPTAAEIQAGYSAGDFEYVEIYNRSSSPVSLSNYYVAGGIGYSPGWLADGMPSEMQTLESGATATWSATSLAAATYTVFAHLNLYDGDNNLRSDMDSAAQYTVTYGAASTTVLVNQNQVPATLGITNLTYNNESGLATAVASNALSAGSIVHISGATPPQYDGTFVVQSATPTSFTYALAAGLNLAAASGTITAGLDDVWVSLGSFAISGALSVQLARTATAKPGEWTVADAVKVVTGQQATQLGGPVLGSYSMQHSVPSLAPGAYAVLASNFSAFDFRNHIAANNILVLGAYSGHLSNGGDTVDIFQIGNRDDGAVAPINGYVPSYRVDHVNYNNASPWPTEPDGNGPSLVRIHTAGYGNDVINWQASNAGGTPGATNIFIDRSAPSIPANLVGQALLSPASAISLTWSASSEPQSNIDHYVVYRNGSSVGSSISTSFLDTTISAGTNYSYSVTAVNRDGYESAPSTSIGIGLPWNVSNDAPNSTQIEIFFSEPLTPGVASQAANYTVSGKTVSGVAVGRDNTRVTLTLSTAMVVGTSYTVSMKNLTTISGGVLPATQTFTFTYAGQGIGSILWEYYANIGGSAVSNLTSASIYPNNPTQTGLESSFEAPHDFADNYGERLRGFLYPPTTGYYIFTIASDDNSQLWLSTTESPTNLVQIAHVDSWTSYRDWSNATNLNQTSIPIYLTAGRRYYVQALQKEGGGGDNLSVRWEIPATTGGAASTWELNSLGNADSTIPIPGIRLSPPATLLDTTTPPAPANLRATLTGSNVALAWSPVLGLPSGVDHYIIYRDGSAYATSITTSYTDASTSQKRHSYQVAAVNYDAVIGVKSVAVTAAPVGIAAIKTPNTTTVTVQFSEPVDPLTAQTVGNYSITNRNCTISAAVLQADGYTVLLTTSEQGSFSHTLTISNIKTLSLSALPSPLTSGFTYAMGSAYVPPSFTAGVNAKFTSDASPGLTGGISDSTASVAVRVYSNGYYTFYAATNNGDGTWSLPRGDISPALGSGAYDVLVMGINVSGIMAFDSTTSDLRIDTTWPTVTITTPTSPTGQPQGAIAIQFSEPVKSFTLQNLQLTLANAGPAASAPVDGATLTTADNQNWTLGYLSGLTAAAGTYTLALAGLGPVITDLSGNPLVAGASTAWIMTNPAVASINRVGSNSITNASSVQFLVTFNRDVSNVLASDFTLATDGAAGTIASVEGSGSAYTVTISGVSGDGALGLNLLDDNSITDAYGNPLGGPNPGDGSFTGQLFTIDDTGPVVTAPASADVNPVSGTTTGLFVGASNKATGEASLTYTWAVVTQPNPAATPTFSPAINGANAAKSIVATFLEAGAYGFLVTITDPLGLTATSHVNVVVTQTLSSIRLAGQPPVATAFDQFDKALANQPALSADSDTIIDPLPLERNITVLPVAGSELGISGDISGVGQSLTLDAGGILVLSGTNTYTGGTRVRAGTLIVAKSSAIAAGAGLTVGAGADAIFASSSESPRSLVVAVASPATASSVATTSSTSAGISNETSGGIAASRIADLGQSRLPGPRPIADKVSPSGKIATLMAVPVPGSPRGELFRSRASVAAAPVTSPLPGLRLRPRPNDAGASVHAMVLAGAGTCGDVSLSTARRIAGELAWLREAASGLGTSEGPDPLGKKGLATLAFEAVFSQYGG